MVWMPRDAFRRNGRSPPGRVNDGKEEPRKVIVSESLSIALRRCTYHFAPILVSAVIMTLDLKGVYLGADLMSPVKSETINLMLLQLAAKAHEIMIVASLGLVVLQFVRHELLFGDGLPLGLIGSGLTFNSLGSFFSKEFYGSLKYIGGHGNTLRKIMFVTVVVVAGLTAALAGPASAVLLVPKSQNWAAGGTQVYLNGSTNDFWPDDLSGDLLELQPFCNRNDSIYLGICPAGGFQSLWDHWGSVNSTNFRGQDLRTYAKKLSGSDFYWPVSSFSSQIPPLYALGNSKGGTPGSTALIQSHAATAVLLQKLATDWWKAWKSKTGMGSDQVDDRIVSASVRNGISVVSCAEPQELASSDNTVNFPSMEGRFDFTHILPFAVDSLNNTAVNHIRFQWVHLPAKFGAVSIGGIFETPWESNKTSRAVIGCTIQAGWVPATVFIDKYTFWTGWYPWNIIYGDRTPAWSATAQEATNGRISFGDDWLNLLTPPTISPGIKSWRPSTIESIFLNAGLGSSPNTVTSDWLEQGTGSQDKVALIEAIVCSVVVDGITRTGSYRVFNTSGPQSQWQLANYNPLPDFEKQILENKPALAKPAVSPGNLTKVEASMEITGFSIQRSLAAYLAMSVLVTHLLMATAHIAYIIRTRCTSSSWGSVAQIIALSQNSPPSDVLENTSGGIKSRKTLLQMAKIRVRKIPDWPNHEHVELLFEGSSFTGHQRNVSEYELGKLHENWSHRTVTWPLNIARTPADTDVDTWTCIMKFWKCIRAPKQQPQRFPLEVAEAFEPEEEIIRRLNRTGSPPGNLLCLFPDPTPRTSLNQFRFQLHRENGVLPGLVGYLEKYSSASHLVWSMCALLADSGIDPDWTDAFEMWRPQWRQFANSFEMQRNISRALDIPPSPVRVMCVRKPHSLDMYKLYAVNPKAKKRDQEGLEDLWRWMLDAPPEVIVQGAFPIKLEVEPWFPGEEISFAVSSSWYE
ncbi:hypothetical protein CBS147311_6100 [Penicillium roqueforti]|nr:hypothetical protein CBS147311_6100 [Penicillium roqueforti]